MNALLMLLAVLFPQPEQKDQASLEVRLGDGRPLITADEIVGYEWAKHTLLVKPGVQNRMKNILRAEKKLAVPFSVMVGDQPIYTGALTTNFSSASNPNVVIVVDNPQVGPKPPVDVLPLSLGYPGPQFFKGDDPRGDERIKTVLQQAGKLRK